MFNAIGFSRVFRLKRLASNILRCDWHTKIDMNLRIATDADQSKWSPIRLRNACLHIQRGDSSWFAGHSFGHNSLIAAIKLNSIVRGTEWIGSLSLLPLFGSQWLVIQRMCRQYSISIFRMKKCKSPVVSGSTEKKFNFTLLLSSPLMKHSNKNYTFDIGHRAKWQFGCAAQKHIKIAPNQTLMLVKRCWNQCAVWDVYVPKHSCSLESQTLCTNTNIQCLG